MSTIARFRLSARAELRSNLIPVSDEWMTQGACIGSDPEPFHSDYRGTLASATKVCTVTPCPVIDECLQFALARMDDEDDDPAQRAIGRFGVWGGTTPVERWRMTGRRSSYTERRTA